MLVTPLPLFTLARLVQKAKVLLPMVVTLSSIVTLVRLLQSEKTLASMLVFFLFQH